MSDNTRLLIDWLLAAAEVGASDLHIVAEHRPTIRLNGFLQDHSAETVASEHMAALLKSICPPDRWSEFLNNKNLDFAPVIDIDGQLQTHLGSGRNPEECRRFRANYFCAEGKMGACFRVIPSTVPDLSWAGFPQGLADRLLGIRNGLILFTGVTGSGKSTSLAMMIRRLIKEGGRRIITIEDPIEYSFSSDNDSLITQREVGLDVQSFSDGLKYGLRQDPDVMLVGEIRDRETAAFALSAAETGHLIFSTMHTRDAKGAVSRLADLFPQSNQHEIRSQLALSLRAVISQHLLPSSILGEKRELALEVMFNTSPISAAIRMGKVESIDNNIQTGKADGMYLMDDSIGRLLRDGRINRETAERFVSDKRNL